MVRQDAAGRKIWDAAWRGKMRQAERYGARQNRKIWDAAGQNMRLAGVSTMTRTLQKRYIRTAMIAVTLVMVIFLIAINLLSELAMQRDLTKTMQLILASESQGPEAGGNEPGRPGIAGDDGGPGAVNEGAGPGAVNEGAGTGAVNEGAGPGAVSEGGGLGTVNEEGGLQKPEAEPPEKPVSGMTRDTLASEQYFSVRCSRSGQVIDTDVSHIMSVDEDDAKALAAEALASGTIDGGIGDYRFRIIEDKAGGSRQLIFLDAAQQQRAVLRTLLVTLIVGAATWVLTLLLVIFMSKKAILPIAENIEKQKQFVTDAGHEIKTPLAIIQANADVLELHMGTNKWIDNIRSQITRLSSLTQNLLTLSRMEEGGSASVPAVTFDAGEALLEALLPFRESAEIRGVSIREDIEEKVQITWQKDAYTRLLTILFENAVKYVREDGFIAVSLRRAGKEIVILQKNDSESELTDDPGRLFDRFYRADKARTQKAGGSGIGLSVARAIAEQGGGTIRASYEDAHTIAFTLKIPIRAK